MVFCVWCVCVFVSIYRCYLTDDVQVQMPRAWRLYIALTIYKFTSAACTPLRERATHTVPDLFGQKT